MPASKEYFQEYYLARKRQLLVELGGEDYACTECGHHGDDLEFDHIDPGTKSFTIGTRIMQSWKKPGRYEELFVELKKCQLLCIDCHKSKTKIDLGGERGWRHGTMYGWQKKKCKCDACTSAQQAYYPTRNEKRRATAESPRGPRLPYGRPAEHGTYLRYKRGCKCDECKSANTEKARQRRLAAKK